MGFRLSIALVASMYLFLWGSLESLPFLDFPNHLTRAVVLQSLIFDSASPYSSLYGFEWLFSTYLLGDLLLVGLLFVMSPQSAGVVFITAAFFLPPLAAAIYAKRHSVQADTKWAVFGVMLFLSSNWFFLSGFLNFQLSIAFALFSIIALERWLEKNTFGRFAQFTVFIALTYFMHIASFVLCGAAAFSIVALKLHGKSLSFAKAMTSLSVFCLFAVAHVLAGDQSGDSRSILETLEFRDPLNKLAAIGSMFYRFYLPLEAILFLVFCSIVGLPIVFGALRQGKFSSRPVQLFVISIVSFIVYLAAPVSMKMAHDVDNRALPFVFIFLLLGSLAVLDGIQGEKRTRRLVHSMVLLLAWANAAYLFVYISEEDARAYAYESIIDSLPPQLRALPISTTPDIGRIQTTLHLGSYYTMKKQGYSPYLFSRNHAAPQTYFYYKEQVEAAEHFWYLRGLDIDWVKIKEGYDLLIVTKPFDRSIFPVDLGEVVAENSAAVVFGNWNRLAASPGLP